MTTLATHVLAAVSGGAQKSRRDDWFANYPGFTNCGPHMYSAGCAAGGMSFDEWIRRSGQPNGGLLRAAAGLATKPR